MQKKCIKNTLQFIKITKDKKNRESLFTFLLLKINAELPSIWPKYFEILISISMTLTMRLFFGFYETRDRKGFLLGCSQSNFGVIPKGDKSDGWSVFWTRSCALDQTKEETGSWLVWHCWSCEAVREA